MVNIIVKGGKWHPKVVEHIGHHPKAGEVLDVPTYISEWATVRGYARLADEPAPPEPEPEPITNDHEEEEVVDDIPDLHSMTVQELRDYAAKHDIELHGVHLKADIMATIAGEYGDEEE